MPALWLPFVAALLLAVPALAIPSRPWKTLIEQRAATRNHEVAVDQAVVEARSNNEAAVGKIKVDEYSYPLLVGQTKLPKGHAAYPFSKACIDLMTDMQGAIGKKTKDWRGMVGVALMVDPKEKKQDKPTPVWAISGSAQAEAGFTDLLGGTAATWVNTATVRGNVIASAATSGASWGGPAYTAYAWAHACENNARGRALAAIAAAVRATAANCAANVVTAVAAAATLHFDTTLDGTGVPDVAFSAEAAITANGAGCLQNLNAANKGLGDVVNIFASNAGGQINGQYPSQQNFAMVMGAVHTFRLANPAVTAAAAVGTAMGGGAPNVNPDPFTVAARAAMNAEKFQVLSTHQTAPPVRYCLNADTFGTAANSNQFFEPVLNAGGYTTKANAQIGNCAGSKLAFYAKANKLKVLCVAEMSFLEADVDVKAADGTVKSYSGFVKNGKKWDAVNEFTPSCFTCQHAMQLAQL